VNDDDVSLAAAGGPQAAGVSRSEAVFVADTLPWSPLAELLRFFGCFGCGSGRGRPSRSIAAVAVVLSAGEVKPRARWDKHRGRRTNTRHPWLRPVKGRYGHPGRWSAAAARFMTS